MSEKIRKKAVFFLTIDCLRRDHLRIYGYKRDTAPNLEKFANDGIIFLNAFANGPETPSSFSAIFTSILPYLNGGFCPLPNQKITFSQILQENNIFTYAIHSNPNLGKFFNYHRGFNVFIDGLKFFLSSRAHKKDIREKIKHRTIKDLFRYNIFKILKSKFVKKLNHKIIHRLVGYNKIRSWVFNKSKIRDLVSQINLKKGFTASYIVKKIINFINQYDYSHPLFLWAHFMDVHNPYNPPPKHLLKFRKRDISAQERDILNSRIYFNREKKYKITDEILSKLIDLYDGEISFIDENLAELFKFIKKKFKNDCLIIITADHGDSFYEHNSLGHQGHLYDELLRVPLIFIELGKKYDKNKIEEYVQLLDIGPTILDYFEIKIPDHFQGKSLIPLINGKSLNRKPLIISESYQKNGFFQRNQNESFKIFSIRTDKWKYFYNEENDREYLFDLSKDYSEKINVIKENSELANTFRTIRDTHFEKIKDSEEKAKIAHTIEKMDIKKIRL
ncbi:MAG: sulfatase-like hydrolase/transferase [Promethearchaeota archaeon]